MGRALSSFAESVVQLRRSEHRGQSLMRCRAQLAVGRRLEEGTPAGQVGARGRLRDESWEAKAAEFERVALALLSPETAGSRR